MRRILTAALLAAPLLLAAPGVASANPGPCTFGYGCGGFCLRIFPHIHQHGPLYNYGPYYGYPPFEPYGYWNPYLQYTGPVGPQGGGGVAHGGKHHGLGGCGGGHSLFGHGCSSCGHQGLLNGGLFHGGLNWGLHKGSHGGCSSCGQAAAMDVNAGNAIDRYAGYGDPSASAAYYVGTPTLTDPAAVMPAGFRGN